MKLYLCFNKTPTQAFTPLTKEENGQKVEIYVHATAQEGKT